MTLVLDAAVAVDLLVRSDAGERVRARLARELRRAWQRRGNVAARDALYVAAARALRGRVLTTDARSARAAPDVVLPT